MNTWFTSDTHFYHENIIRFCNRPYWTDKGVYEDGEYRGEEKVPDMAAMNADMIKRWNSRVQPGELVYHLGDFCFGNPAKWNDILDQLNGNIVLVRGNHDDKNLRNNEMMARFARIETELYVPVRNEDDQELYIIWMNHFPPKGSDNDPRELYRPKPTQYYDFSFCGHVHNAWVYHNDSDTINVGADMWDFKPRRLTEILANAHDGINAQFRERVEEIAA